MIAGIDPGRWKTGFALAEGGRLLFSAIIPSDKKDVLIEAVKSGRWELLAEWRQEGSSAELPKNAPEAVYVGSGTSSAEFRAALSFPHKVAEEYGTTIEAREIYWRLHAPRGLMKLVPTSLRTPPRNVDDLAAYAILLRGAEAAESEKSS